MTPPVAVSYGMGTESTALLLRWIHEPSTRPCGLEDLLVVTAQTGDVWPLTGQLVTRHMLPLFRQHHIRASYRWESQGLGRRAIVGGSQDKLADPITRALRCGCDR